jgi:acyl carrier protein
MNGQKESVRHFIETRLLGKGKHVGDDDKLFSSGAIDSLGVLELIAFLEKSFKVNIDTQKHELCEFDTVNLIVSLLIELMKGRYERK